MIDLGLEIIDNRTSIVKIIISDPFQNGCPYQKIIVRPIVLKGCSYWQAEQYKNNKVFHNNILEENFNSWFNLEVCLAYRQVVIYYCSEVVTYSLSRNGLARERGRRTTLSYTTFTSQEHNRKKVYLLNEGENIPALVDLGIFTKDFRVVKSKYDKYKQINRFLELIDDIYSDDSAESITILDFGCGKSYLTFILYYYFHVIRKIKARIIGYDLKQDVVENCNKIAQKYGYQDLCFYVNDVSKDLPHEENVDMIVSLHACDTATDYALNYAMTHKVKNIFAVPCCQHEINLSIKKGGGDLDIFLKHGIIAERMSALLTDEIRSMLLEDFGYSVDMIEFVDFEHSPKNIMIRAHLNGLKSIKNRRIIEELMKRYKFHQTLVELVKQVKGEND